MYSAPNTLLRLTIGCLMVRISVPEHKNRATEPVPMVPFRQMPNHRRTTDFGGEICPHATRALLTPFSPSSRVIYVLKKGSSCQQTRFADFRRVQRSHKIYRCDCIYEKRWPKKRWMKIKPTHANEFNQHLGLGNQ